MRKTVFMINPMSASGKTALKWPSISTKASSMFPNSEFIFTNSAGEAEELTRKVIESGAESVIAVGGDGTLNEVVNGYFQSDDTPINSNVSLGVLPMGTGSDFCRSLGIPRQADKALEILKLAPRKIDCGIASVGEKRRFFDNIGSIGISGDIARHFEQHGKNGISSYVTGLFKSARRYEKRGFSIRYRTGTGAWESRELPDAFIAVIANGKYFGGGMSIAPQANLIDGLFHCILVKGMSGLEILRYLPSLFSGRHLKHPPFSDFKANEIEINVTAPSWLELDGEPSLEVTPTQPLTIKILQKTLNFHIADASIGSDH